MSEPMKTAFVAAELRLKIVRQEIINFVDSGGGNDHEIRLRQGDLTRWFDTLECVSGLIRSAERYATVTSTRANSHDALVEVVEEFVGMFGSSCPPGSIGDEVLQKAKTVLSTVTSHNRSEEKS